MVVFKFEVALVLYTLAVWKSAAFNDSLPKEALLTTKKGM